MRVCRCVFVVIMLMAPIAAPAGDGAIQITSDPARNSSPCWSPDGSLIAFTSHGGGTGGGDIWVIPSTGGTATRITTHPLRDCCPAWSPDGSLIAFQSDRNGSQHIHLIPATGGAATQLTYGGMPAWSLDGHMLAFSSRRSGNDDIWVIPVGGGEARQLTDHSASDNHPEWSPDGKWVAYTSNATGREEVYRLLDGEVEQVTNTFEGGSWSALQTDTGIVFTSAPCHCSVGKRSGTSSKSTPLAPISVSCTSRTPISGSSALPTVPPSASASN